MKRETKTFLDLADEQFKTDEPVVEEKQWKAGYGPNVTVQLLHGVEVKHDGEKYFVVYTNEGGIKGYLVKPEMVENTYAPQVIDVSDAVQLYGWEAELKLIFDNIETVRRNALLSFWKAGALFETDKANPKIVATMFDSAFPYRMP